MKYCSHCVIDKIKIYLIFVLINCVHITNNAGVTCIMAYPNNYNTFPLYKSLSRKKCETQTPKSSLRNIRKFIDYTYEEDHSHNRSSIIYICIEMDCMKWILNKAIAKAWYVPVISNGNDISPCSSVFVFIIKVNQYYL